MPKFRVYMMEHVFYSVEVEAEDETAAKTEAEARFDRGEQETDGYDDWRITDVEEVPCA